MRNFNDIVNSYSAPRRYVLAFLLILLALALRFTIAPVEYGIPYVTFYPAIVLIFYICGNGPGIFSILLSATVSFYIFFFPYFTWSVTPESGRSSIAYLVSACIIGYIVSRSRHFYNLSLRHKQEIADIHLAQSKDSLKLALDAARFGTWRRYLQSGRIILSDVTAQIFGLSPDTVVDVETFRKLLHPDDVQRVSEAAAKSIQDHTHYTAEYRVIWPDGSVHWVSSHGRTHYLPDGTAEYLFGIFQDITERKQMEQSLRELNTNLEAKARERAEELYKVNLKLNDTLTKTISAMAITMEMRDPYTAGHEFRVAALSDAIGRVLGWSEDRLQPMHLAAMVHDMGKISIPAEILTKPTKLSGAEFAIIKEHPETAYNILKDIPFGSPVAEMVRQHHEKLDGSGYPLGITAEKILPESRVLAVADIVEAMSSDRPYRAAIGIEQALAEIERLAEVGKLDPEVVRACCTLFREQGYIIPAPHY